MNNSMSNLYRALRKIGLSISLSQKIEKSASISIADEKYLGELGLKGPNLAKVIKLIKDFSFEKNGIDKIANTNNFFRCDIEHVYFWGMDIESKRIKMNKRIEKMLVKYGYDKDGDIIELFDDDSISFFKKIYMNV